VVIADATAGIAEVSAATYFADATVEIFTASPPNTAAGITDATGEIDGIFAGSPITAAVGIANATVENATTSTIKSAADAKVDATMGNFPVSPITATAGSANPTA
jgi:hypothetical protein